MGPSGAAAQVNDAPAYVVDRLRAALWREAFHLVEQGVCDSDSLDLIVRDSLGPALTAMGPMENADYIGLDVVHALHRSIYPHLCDASVPSVLLRHHVDAGELGAKTGSGFLPWSQRRHDDATHRLQTCARSGSVTCDDRQPARPAEG